MSVEKGSAKPKGGKAKRAKIVIEDDAKAVAKEEMYVKKACAYAWKSGDIVLAQDKGSWYPAKVLKEQTLGEGKLVTRKYFIHFQGWARKYDTWLDEALLASNDDASVQALMRGQKKSKTSAAGGGGGGEEESDAGSTEKQAIFPSLKRKAQRVDAELQEKELRKRRLALSERDQQDDDQEGVEAMKRMNIPMPLKTHLVNEWSLITTEPKRLVKLPRVKTVENIFRDYLEFKQSKVDAEQYVRFVELFEGLQLYFDKALPTILLYRQEREQYDQLMKVASTDLSCSQLYGGEHLLRLFVRMPRLLAQVFLDPAEVSLAQARFTDFLKYLQKNQEQYIIVGDYVLVEEGMTFDKELLSPGRKTRGKA